MTYGRGPALDLTDEDTTFLFGQPLNELPADGPTFGRLWNRTLADAGVGAELSKVGMSLADLPDDGATVTCVPDATGTGIDVVSLLLGQFADRKAADQRYEHATNRWRKIPDRTSGYIPADAGSIRWTMMPASRMPDRIPHPEGHGMTHGRIHDHPVRRHPIHHR